MQRLEDVLSPRTTAKCSRLRGAKVGSSVCQFCAVGCSQLAFIKDGTLINVEGDPRSPVNQGRQCPKGGSTFFLNENPRRFTHPMYRAPGSKEWKQVSPEWIIQTIADRIWDTREKGFQKTDENGHTVNRVDNFCFIGGSANDNEECYLFKKLFTGGLGVVPIENTARYCHSTTVAALAPTFGFGAATNPPRDLVNSDFILVMGSNMAEAHPVASYWLEKARQNGAVTMHVDPRYTRTSAVCDHHAPILPGTDIAFLGAVIKYVLDHGYYFRDYIVHFTNAATLINPEFNFDQETGLFSGWDEKTGSYALDGNSWDYQYEINPDGSVGVPKTDPTLEDKNCVFQILRKQFQKYTPESVAKICGCRPADIIKVAEFFGRNSGKERTSAFVYATGFTQHASGTQIIRSAAILQLLLGNIGRPGGGIIALRGHSNVQGATDVPSLFNELPNYIPQPWAIDGHWTLKDYLKNGKSFLDARNKDKGMWQLDASRGAWAKLPNYMVSLLKAWYGDTAKPENEFCYQYLPKIPFNESMTETIERMMKGEVEGAVVMGQNIAVSNPNTHWGRTAFRKLKWLVVGDLFENEIASVWYADPQAPNSEECQTEVFFLPCATNLEKEGSVTNTERLIQWHKRVKNAPGQCQSDAWWIFQIGLRLKEKALGDVSVFPDALRALTWDYLRDESEENPDLNKVENDIDLIKVIYEMNGWNIGTREFCKSSADLRDDGTTLCGCRLLSGMVAPNGDIRPMNDEAGEVDHELDLDYRYAWPNNSRILYNRCSADPEGKPWSERKKLIWWDEAQKKWLGFDNPNFDSTKPPCYRPTCNDLGDKALAGDAPFTVHSDGKAWLFVPYGIKEGPLPVHHETTESPYHNVLFSSNKAPQQIVIDDPMNRMADKGDPEYPTLITTYHLVEHWLTGAQTRNIPWLCALQPESFVEISPEMAESKGIESGDLIKVYNTRTSIVTHALVTPRIRIGEVLDKPTSMMGAVMCSGYKGLITSNVINDLSPAILAADGFIPASKGFVVNFTKAEPKDLIVGEPDKEPVQPEITQPIPLTPWAAQPEGRE